MKKEIRKSQAIDVIVVVYFNEDVHAKIIQEFMLEIGSYDVFSEVHDAEEKIDMEHSNMVQSA